MYRLNSTTITISITAGSMLYHVILFKPYCFAPIVLLKYLGIIGSWYMEGRHLLSCFIQKIYNTSSLLQGKHLPFFPSLLQGKHLPFSPSHFASIFFTYLWSFRWPNDIVTLTRYFSLRLPHLNIPTGPPSDELDKNISERSLFYF